MRTNYHNEGQRDGAENTYNPPAPSSIVDLFIPDSWADEFKEMNDTYDKGWTNGYKSR